MFHLILTIIILIAAIRYVEWNRWREFLPTVYFVVLLNWYYLYISESKIELWQHKNSFISIFVTDSMYSFVLLPCLTFMFLSNFPEKRYTKIFRYIKYIVISILIEIIALQTNNFTVKNGWNLGWELFFYPVMYFTMRLHYLTPIRAIILSILVVIFLLAAFRVDIF
jgi:hypothetical protein